MKLKLRLLLFFVLSIFAFAVVYYISKTFFQSQMMVQFIWNINTFRGMFAHLPKNLPKEHIIGSYAFAFKDYYMHLPRTVSQNATYYSFFLGFLGAASVLCYPFKQNGKLKAVVTHSIIIALGLGVRLFFAYHTTGNHDMVSWYIDKSVLEEGKNIFAVTDRYNYSTFWLSTLKFLMKINHFLPQFPFMFIVRAFLTLVDFISLWFVIKIAKLIGFSGQKAGALFFLNPVTIIISGYHGQFDNIPVLFLLVAIYLFVLYERKTTYFSWFLVTLGVIAKHEILQQSLILLRWMKRSNVQVFALFLLTVSLFLLCFVPYWKEGSVRILENVFRYGGISRPYGLAMFDIHPVVAQLHKYLFIGLLLVWPFYFKTKHLWSSSLIGMLLFLVFTSGVSAQQFVLPIALAALQPSIGFYLFSFVTSLFLLGNIDELKMVCFEFVGWNSVWLAVFIWFILEVRKSVFENRAHRLLFQKDRI